MTPPRYSGPGPPRARTTLEASFYTTLHPCPCGRGGSETSRRAVIQLDDGVGIEFSGTCQSCRRYRRFVFRGPEENDNLSSGVPCFGTGTSDLLDAGEWLWIAEIVVGVGPAVDHVPQGEAAGVSIAVAAVEEALKFIPAGQRTVPQDALWSARSRLAWVADPGQFSRDRFLALRDTYRERLTGIGHSAQPSTGRSSGTPTGRLRVQRAGPLRLQVPGRCPSGSFSPDGSELAVASGFQWINNQPVGEVCVFSMDTGECIQRHEFEAYHVTVLHGTDGLLVADWQNQDNWLQPGCLARYVLGRREVLIPDVGINRMVHTPDGFAALTYQGDLLVGPVSDIRVLPPPGPTACLAADPQSGRLAVGGDRLVLLDSGGRQLAATTVPNELHIVVFLSPDRLVTADPETVTLWRHNGDALIRQASTDRMPRLYQLVALPERSMVIGVDRQPTVMAAEISGDSVRIVAPHRALHGRDVWAMPSGALIALPDRINQWLPPAPEQIEVHDTTAW